MHRLSALAITITTTAALGLAAPNAYALSLLPTDVRCGISLTGNCLIKAEAPGSAGSSGSSTGGGGASRAAAPAARADVSISPRAVTPATAAEVLTARQTNFGAFSCTGNFSAGLTAADIAACFAPPAAPVAPGAPAPTAPPPPEPAVVAQVAISNMNLRPVTIGIVPENTPGKIGVVGAPTWMWAANPGEATTGPITRSATAGGVTVQATAALDRVVWAMGDGSSVTCDGTAAKGTPYYDAAGLSSSPTCGHTYTQPSDNKPGLVYTVTATSYWTINWAGGGGAGVIPQVLANQTQIQVGELQAIVTK